MSHEIAKYLQKNNHTVTVYGEKTLTNTFEGVEIFNEKTANIKHLIQAHDVILTYLGYTKKAIENVNKTKPVVVILHGPDQVGYFQLNLDDIDLLVYNSYWIKEKEKWDKKNIVLNPPIDPDDYKTTRGDKITLINLSPNKGGELFWELALHLPEKNFLGVLGGYDRQIIPDVIPQNVEIVENTVNMKKIYSQTRILLTPSLMESWGRVAIEAAASGIPVIAHPGEGLKESLDYAGIFINRENTEEWVSEIKKLDDVKYYQTWSNLVSQRSSELYSTTQLENFEKTLTELCENFHGKS